MASARQQAIKKLDKAFSRFIRLRACDEYGVGECFTCETQKHWKEVDAGHFQSRSKYSTRWDEMNVQFQCKGCNMTNGGQQYEFGLRLDHHFGEGTAEDILIKSNQTRKFTTKELQEMTKDYQQRVNEMLNGLH
jgi:hypothetical protein